MPAELTPEQWQPIDTEIHADRTIQAIKLYRTATGVGLAEAKQAVDARRDAIIPESNKQRLERKSGCMSALLIVLASAAALIRLCR